LISSSRYLDLTNALGYPDGVAYLVVLHDISVQDNPKFDHVIKFLKILKKDKLGNPKNGTLNFSSFFPSNTKDFIRFKSTSELISCYNTNCITTCAQIFFVVTYFATLINCFLILYKKKEKHFEWQKSENVDIYGLSKRMLF
jgi:hypothetical protein